MTKTEIAKLLVMIGSMDGRTFAEKDVEAWHALLEPISYPDAHKAVIMTLRRSPEKMIKAGDIWSMAATQTDGDRDPMANLQDCEQGNFCRKCKGVHWPHESCDVLLGPAIGAPTVKALLSGAFKTVTDAVESIAVEVAEVAETLTGDIADAMEAERKRQLDLLADLVKSEEADEEKIVKATKKAKREGRL